MADASRDPDTARASARRRTLNRRRFLAGTAQAACAAGVAGLGLTLLVSPGRSQGAQSLRPPGALPESDFLGACLRCGLCVEACPWDILVLATFSDPAVTGTPYFEARENPCLMCDDIPCVPACPSGALDPELTNINDARMGLAVLIDRKNCLNLLGLRCDVCYRVCPLLDKAISLVISRNSRTGRHAIFEPVVNPDSCTGCGQCEKACVLDIAAIKVLPRDLALGKAGDHYRLGWKEKKKAGKSLIPKALDLPDRLPGGES